jgi:hypothetical protein
VKYLAVYLVLSRSGLEQQAAEGPARMTLAPW